MMDGALITQRIMPPSYPLGQLVAHILQMAEIDSFYLNNHLSILLPLLQNACLAGPMDSVLIMHPSELGEAMFTRWLTTYTLSHLIMLFLIINKREKLQVTLNSTVDQKSCILNVISNSKE